MHGVMMVTYISSAQQHRCMHVHIEGAPTNQDSSLVGKTMNCTIKNDTITDVFIRLSKLYAIITQFFCRAACLLMFSQLLNNVNHNVCPVWVPG
jgi:hypothetical protein